MADSKDKGATFGSESGDTLGRSIPERRYRKPPALEALCEIYFEDSAWDDTVPGAFYGRIKERFPTKRQGEMHEAEVTLGPSEAKAGFRRLPPRMLFVSEERHQIIQLAENLLVINQLQPYPHFEEWEPEIHRSLEIYEDLTHPRKIARLGLRYINRVIIPGDEVPMADYFTIYPNLPEGMGDTHGSFLVRVEVPGFERDHSILITFGSALPRESGQEENVFMLDLYDIILFSNIPDMVDIKKEIRQAHNNIVVAFENSITDRLRGLFEPANQQ